jgi:exopolyphosphatase / guanosine-5'-triphosphate,3'-diphosphate pyrophosphatase
MTTTPANTKITTNDDDLRLAAVIEIGSKSVRMAVAELGPRGSIRPVDNLQQTIPLGKDTFTTGVISRNTMEDCVRAIRQFKALLQEHGLSQSDVLAVATSAVREADNVETFLDRLYIATGLHIKVLDQAEVNRLVYLAVRPELVDNTRFKRSDTLVIEVGGGSTEILMFRQGKVGNAHLYRTGSMRLRQAFDDFAGSSRRQIDVLRSEVDQAVKNITNGVLPCKSLQMLALGGEARFACTRIDPSWKDDKPGTISVKRLETLTNKVLDTSADELVQKYKMTYPDAETVGPALLVYLRLAQSLKLETILASRATLRDGLLRDLQTRGTWSREFRRQILNSTILVAKKYDVDIKASKLVARYCDMLFTALAQEHGLDDRYALILEVAALLHQTGHYVSGSSHHKHSMYLIMNSDIFGLGSNEITLTALVARYHRRSLPRPTHDEFAELPQEERVIVAKLAAILRLATALAHGTSTRVADMSASVDEDQLIIHSTSGGDLAFLEHRLSERDEMFEQTYGMDVVLRQEK